MLPKDLPPLADRVLVLHAAEERRHLRPAQRPAPRRPAAGPRPPAAALRGDHRQPVGPDDRKRGPHGYDAGKGINGRKRHILVDALGLIISVVVHAADIQDRDGAKLVLAPLRHRFARLRLLVADAIYNGGIAEW